MSTRKRIVLLVFIGLSFCGVFPNAVAHIPLSDRSPYAGRPVTHPEALSGVWEVSDGKGGAVGIQLELSTTVSAGLKTLSGMEQKWQSLVVGMYQRAGATIWLGEENFFSDSPRGGNVTFEKGRLELHSKSISAAGPSFDLDLAQQSGKKWTGRFHRGNFDSIVTLSRPGAALKTHISWLSGTWLDDLIPHYSCVHIFEQAPNEFVAWSDSLQVMGVIRSSPNLPEPTTVTDVYGLLMKIQLQDNGKISFAFNVLNGLCCPGTFIGRPEGNGRLIRGIWTSGMNKALPKEDSWRKMSGSSCVASGR